MAAGGVTWGGKSQRYRKRKPLPALLLLVLLGVGATIVWIKVVDTDQPVASRKCPVPTSTAPGQPPVPAGQSLADDALDRTTPAVPSQTVVRVVNGSGQRGQAAAVSEALKALGFDKTAKPLNGDMEMDCRGQIRFGHQGTSAARTLSLIEPCAELVRDDRQDATVDLAVGGKFDELRPKPEARQVLQQLTEWGQKHPAQRGGLQEQAGAAPTIDGALLAGARQARC
ncbi:LytR cell envelope-related transcriptional attenuator [Herbihabitans rhizosphaerae]|uniref:LytR cell envelope-related transcriptional attenuator n=1 Tax=Herbihabitans rhizosphaerae TaxID=1872711 RepID=A0A4Q7KIP2_9PSEU|nr:envelope integrity protein Cei [Herbihabitans rhizosphaerae]RZS34464.1 LytR cell envelope-related transcriptional attenuator [Herbihabitans rhizosphaerae]